MHRRIRKHLLFIIAVAIGSAGQASAEDDSAKFVDGCRFDFESAIIKVRAQVPNEPLRIDQVVYVKDHGARISIHESVQKTREKAKPVRTVYQWENGKTHVIDHTNKRIASPSVVPQLADLCRPDPGGDAERSKRLADEKILGVDAAVYETSDAAGAPLARIWWYKGASLKVIDMTAGRGQISSIATDLKENVEVPDVVFRIPAGYAEN